MITFKEMSYLIMAMPTNKAPGKDRIPMRVSKDCLPHILPAITMLNNSSFTTIYRFSHRFLKENIKSSNTNDKLKATRRVKTTKIDLISKKKPTLHVQHTFFSN